MRHLPVEDARVILRAWRANRVVLFMVGGVGLCLPNPPGGTVPVGAAKLEF